MSNTRMVNLKNMVNKTVGVKLPEYGVNRKWTTKGQVIPLPYDTVEQMLWHEGFRKMIDRGILYIENMQDKMIKLARGGFKHHTCVGVGHMKEILKEAFTTYLGYEWVDID